MTAKGYMASGRFIHDELVRRCVPLVETAQRLWREKKNDPSIVILWPSEPLKAADGSMVEDEVIAALPKADREARLRKLVETTKAYGLLLIELKPNALFAVFESPHGTHSWTSRIEYRGDVYMLARAEEKNNVDHLNLLWSPQQGTA